jgi:type VI protein secretion system component Hcp
MPGFMMFEEYGITDDGMMVDLAKAALRRLPMAWVAHGIKGEYNIDIDPVAMLRGDGTDLLNFSEAYAAWISVRSINQTIEGAANRDRQELNKQWGAAAGGNGAGAAPPAKRTAETTVSNDAPPDHRGELTVDIEIDASLTQLIKAALEPGGKKFAVAEIHMCTTAQIDLSQLNPGNNNPAAGLIQTLAAALLFNIIPYLTIVMKNVTIESINFSLQGEQNDPPSATLSLKFEKVKWVYHIINQSNMNLIDMTAEYDYTIREEPDSGPSLGVGVVVNPFG